MFTKEITINDNQEAALTKLAALEAETTGEPAKTAEQYLNGVLSDTLAGLRARYLELRRGAIINALTASDNATLAEIETLLGL